MVLTIPEVSKCEINNEREIAELCSGITNSGASTVIANYYNLTQLGNILQQSLDTNKILQLFFKYIKHYFKLTNMLYINSDSNISIILGNKFNTISKCPNNIKNKKNIKQYDLYYQKQYLGELYFSCKHKLIPQKILELKSYVNLLILPLKNSILYQKAIAETRLDPLSQTGNRLALLEDLKYHFNLCTRYNNSLSLLFIDIDYFKKINDQYGHIIGDKVIIKFADVLKSIVRKSDSVYRFGGEEFVILLENTNQLGAVNLAKKLNKFINKYNFNLNLNKKKLILNITISIGIVTKHNNDSHENTESLIQRADEALYSAKQSGRNCYIVAP